MNKLLLVLTAFILPFTAYAQGYEIKVHAKGLGNKTVYLAHHFANNKRILADDTLQLNKNGKGVFKGNKKLKGGMYLIFFPNRSYFDFLLGDNQEFSITLTQANPLQNAAFRGSEINSAFLDYRKFIRTQRKKMNEAQKAKKAAKKADDKNAIQQQNKVIDAINQEVKEKRQELAKEYEGTFLTEFLQATMQIEVPDPPKDAAGNITDSLFQYRYYKSHYWDNFDVSNPKLLRTTLYESKLMDYLQNVVQQHPDTLVKETEKIVEASRHDDELFRYVLGTLYNHYNKSKVMGMEKVFANLAQYYISGKADWNDSTFVADIKERVEKMQNTFIGDTAKNFLAPTAKDKHIRLHEIDAPYTVIYFYDPECGHCKEETPVMKKVSDKYIDEGIQFIGFYTQVDEKNWESYIEKNNLHQWINVWDPYNRTNFRFNYNIYSTPTIYILDEDKRIIAKRIGAEKTGDILKSELNNQ